MRRILLLALIVITVSCGSQSPRQVAHRGQTPREPQTAADAPVAREAQTARDGQTAVPTDNDELTVYITDTGQRYHLSTCRMLRASRHPISLAEAKRRGYTPCKICWPPR